ncbi:MAG TPA: peptide chain release factor N(5)-glutamine methyltransferase [Casimicrobiaceae bacterium]|nr:peptide chain release factor N(5)-glutamine methyltransferase [Casimicrobiaceae bacterium]
MKVREALAQAGLVPVDGRVLLAHVLDRDRAWLLAHADDDLARADADAFFGLARRRRDGEPVAYLTGRREFWGLDLRVTPAVLIPRPETETLVEAVLERLPAGRPLRVLDLGTGSGAIALALARERPLAGVVAADASRDALDVARANAERLGLANVAFARTDWYAGIPGERFDAIVSNPPYIAGGDPHLVEGDLRYEPRAALSPGGDGMAALRTIVSGAPGRLAPGGLLAVEHGHDQPEAVRRLFEAAGFTSMAVRRDLAGIARVCVGELRG